MNRIALMVLRNWWRVPYYYSKLCRYANHVDEYPEIERWQHIQKILRLGIGSGNVELTVTGLENLPKENGFMLYGNHQGMFDVVAIASSCDIPLGAVLKKELVNIPFLKQVVACTKSFAMDREDVRQSLTVIQNVIAEIKAGRNYVIFPEGTRSKKGNEMLPFHHGSFRCAVKTKCPIVPMALVDSFKVFDQKGSKPLSVQLHYLDPIYYEEYAGMSTVELAQLVQERIRLKIQQSTEEV